MQNSKRQSGIVYLVGISYVVRALVSIWSLRTRAKCTRPVAILAMRGSLPEDIGEAVRRSNLDATVTYFDAAEGENRALLAKTRVDELTPFSTTLFVDADTVIKRSLDALFDEIEARGIVVTRFAGLTSWDIADKIRQWRGIRADLDTLVARSLQREWPAVNTGVFGFATSRQNRALFARWNEIATLGRNLDVPDELSMQLLLPDLPASNVISDLWNHSPLIGDRHASARVMHFHNSSHRTALGQASWVPLLRELYKSNAANIRQWGNFDEDVQRL